MSKNTRLFIVDLEPFLWVGNATHNERIVGHLGSCAATVNTLLEWFIVLFFTLITDWVGQR